MKKGLSLIIALIMLISVSAEITANAVAETANSYTRIFGENRYETSIEISKIARNSADNVIIASGLNFPDALSGGVLAHALNAPILLTNGKTNLESAVLSRISQIGTGNIYILGGDASVSSAIESQLKNSYNVERICGNNRYETSVAIAQKIELITGSSPEAIFVTDSLEFADALSITPVAALLNAPIIFTPNNSTGLNAVSAGYVKTCGAKTAVIVGGTSAVKSDVESKLNEMGLATDRVFGNNRYETSANIYHKYKVLFAGDAALIVTGRAFPDALSGGVLGGKVKAPLFLVNGTGTTSAPIKSAIAELKPGKIYVLGGNSVITDTVVNSHTGSESSSTTATTTTTNTPTATAPIIGIDDPNGDVWWSGTASGKAYHSHPDCANMNNPVRIKLSDALAKGLTPCKMKCCYG